MAKIGKTKEDLVDDIERLTDICEQQKGEIDRLNQQLVSDINAEEKIEALEKQYEELAHSTRRDSEELACLKTEIATLQADIEDQEKNAAKDMTEAVRVIRVEHDRLHTALEEIALHPEASGTHQADLAKAALRGS
jgi:hypothetical protein